MNRAPFPWRAGRVLACLFAALAAAAAPARAERADHDQPTHIEADHQSYDDLKQVSIFTGNVIMTRGTLRLTGARAEVHEDPEGYQYAQVDSTPDVPATFRQRRDSTHPGVEEYVDGHALHIDFDGRADLAKLIGDAFVRREENGVERDEMSGARIDYDNHNGTYEVYNQTQGTPAPANGGQNPAAGAGTGRVRVTIAPRNPSAAAGSGAAVTLKPDSLPPARAPGPAK